MVGLVVVVIGCRETLQLGRAAARAKANTENGIPRIRNNTAGRSYHSLRQEVVG